MALIFTRTSFGPGTGREAVVEVRFSRPSWEVTHCLISVGRDVVGGVCNILENARDWNLRIEWKMGEKRQRNEEEERRMRAQI